MKKIIGLFLLLAIQFVFANVSLPYIFSNNMVLQRNSKIPVWGFADPGEKITVSFKNQTKTTIAEKNGTWKILLNEEKEGGPFELKIKANNELIFRDILIGDVWFCSGQSNMEWDMLRSEGYEKEMAQNAFPAIRQIKILKAVSTSPENNIVPTEWKVANTKTLADFSGVAYYFAKKIQQETKVPVGIINCSWGGTNIETWIPRDAFENSEDFKQMISKLPAINGEEFRNQINEIQKNTIEQKINGKISDFKASDFLDNNFDDSKLTEIYAPKVWEEQGYSFDGVAWYRKTIELSASDITKDAKIYLGMIDDNDETYFNGTKVGETNQFDAHRIYTIPKNILKEGKNVIVVKITDNGGGGGIWGNDKLKLETSNNIIQLSGNWKFYVERLDKNFRENDFPTLVYNGMVAPLVSYSVKGFLWYQGESNADRAYEYNKSFPLLINSWREKFGKIFLFISFS